MFERCFFILIVLFFVSCSTTKEQISTISQGELTVLKRLKNFQQLINSSEEFIAYYQDLPSTPKIPFDRLHVKVFDVKKQTIIFEKELRNGKVKWIDDYTLKLDFMPAVISKNPAKNIYGYILNIKSGEIIQETESNH